MARHDYRALVEQGASCWNAWRAQHLHVLIDLKGVDLQGRDLKGMNLRRVVLATANLRRSNLEGSDLSESVLRGANLTEAICRGANLCGADLREVEGDTTSFEGASLDRADCRRARLMYSVFSGARLDGADFGNADLSGTRFRWARLRGTQFTGAHLWAADFNSARLHRADFAGANLDQSYFIDSSLREANLTGAILTGASFQWADLTKANLTGANLTDASLRRTSLVETNVRGATLENCDVYGVSVWNIKGTPKVQRHLRISPGAAEEVGHVTVDDIEVAQFVFLLLNRAKLRNVIESITSKAVLILGRFGTKRKIVLNSIADYVRACGLVPIIFDFGGATSRDFTETVHTLASLSLFVVADITRPRSVPLELQALAPNYQVPFLTIIEAGQKPFSMFRDLWAKHNWVLPPVSYRSVAELGSALPALFDTGWSVHLDLQARKAQELPVRLAADLAGPTRPGGPRPPWQTHRRGRAI